MARMKKTGCEKSIANWDSPSTDCWDLLGWLHLHFARREPFMRNFLEAANEARRVWKIAFKEDVKEYSPIAVIFKAAVMSSFEMTCRDIAKRLGVTPDNIRSVFEDEEECWLPEFVEIANKYKKRKAVQRATDPTT